MGCSHTIIPASEGHLFACPGSRIGSRVRWIRANDEALRAAGVGDAAIAEARAIVDAALSALATMMMHCSAMRLGLGIRGREVVAGT